MIPASVKCRLVAGLFGVAVLAACADSAHTPAASSASSLSTDHPDVRALHARCAQAMVRSACVAAKDASTSETPSSPVVMLAGVGAVDARFYAKLRAAGDSMCEVLVQPCEKSWDGSECRTARALWAAP
jgi:hypothetical protein